MTTSILPDSRPEKEGSERRRRAPSRFVQSFLRLVKACLLYDDSNEAVKQLVPPAATALSEYCAIYETAFASLLFCNDQVFVNRRMMRDGRDTYLLALQLGPILEHCNVNEIRFERSTAPEMLARAARLLADGQRSSEAATCLQDAPPAGVTTRKVATADAEIGLAPDESAIGRVVRDYATAILLLQAFYEQGQGTTYQSKRIAQRLVALFDMHPELLMATAAGPLPDDGIARRAVSTAVVTLGMTRLITDDRATHSAVTQAALLADLGRAWLGAQTDTRRLPAATLGILTAIGDFHPPSIRRSVLAYEALRIETSALPANAGTTPVLAVMLQTARRFNAHRAPTSGVRRKSIDAAIREVETAARGAPLPMACARLLIGALGFYQPGTMVELNTGEVAVVSSIPSIAIDFGRPMVRVMSDTKGLMLASPVELNLAKQPHGKPQRRILRLMEMVQPSGR